MRGHERLEVYYIALVTMFILLIHVFLPGMSCDNCIKHEKGDISRRDITDIAKTLVLAVSRLESNK